MLSKSTIAVLPVGAMVLYGGDGEATYSKKSSAANVSFALAYIDNDSIPELIIKTRDNLIDTYSNSKVSYSLMAVFTWKDGKIYRVAYGYNEGDETPLFRGYYKKKGIFVERRFYCGYHSSLQDHQHTDSYYKLSGTKASIQLMYSYWIDKTNYYVGAGDKEVNKSTFQSKLKAITGGAAISTVTFRKNTAGNRKTYLK